MTRSPVRHGAVRGHSARPVRRGVRPREEMVRPGSLLAEFHTGGASGGCGRKAPRPAIRRTVSQRKEASNP